MRLINYLLGYCGLTLVRLDSALLAKMITAEEWRERESVLRRRINSLSANLNYHRKQLALLRKGDQ